MRFLVLVLAIAVATAAQATTRITVQINGPISTHGYTDAQVLASLERAFKLYEDVCDVDFRIVSQRGRFKFSSGTLHSGGFRHARGWFIGNQIQIHNGRVPCNTSATRPCPFDWKAFSSEAAMSQIIAHELGHAIFGPAHSSDTSCIMHSNATATQLCPAEIRRCVAMYGPPKKPKPVNLPPIAVADAVTMDQDTAIVIWPIRNDSDPERQPISLKSISPKNRFVQNQTKVGDSIAFLPRAGWAGTHRIRYTVTDGTHDADGIITVTVNRVTYSWQNPRNKFDVNGSGTVTAMDLNLLNNAIGRKTRIRHWYQPDPSRYYDVNNDRKLNYADAALVEREIKRLSLIR